jgi:hypothetical protein
MFLLHCYDHNDTNVSQNKIRTFWFYCIVTISMTRWSYWVNSEYSLSSALLRSQCHDYLTVKSPSILYVLHCYDHNDTNMSLIKRRAFSLTAFYDHNAAMIFLSKLWAFSSYCIVTITMPRWSLWENSVQCVSTALLRPQRHDDLTEKSTNILFLLHCYDQNASMISLSKLRAFYFYCILTIKMPRGYYWVKTKHSISTSLLRSLWHYDHTV